MKKTLICTLLVSFVLTVSSLAPANAKDCSKEEELLSIAQSAVVGATAAVSSAKSAVAAAKAQQRRALLPGQRAGATVNVYRAEKDLSKTVKILTAAQAAVRAAKSTLASCKP
jgi:hypothetical protein